MEKGFLLQMEVNGDARYVRILDSPAHVDFTNKKESATVFETEEEARSEIYEIDGKYAFFKPFLGAVSTEEGENSQRPFDSTEDFLGAELEKITKRLNKDLVTANMKVMDLEHYMELRDLNARQGYEAYRMMKDARIERRKVKDKLQLIEDVKQQIINTEDGFKERRYKPRVLKNLIYNKEDD